MAAPRKVAQTQKFAEIAAALVDDRQLEVALGNAHVRHDLLEDCMRVKIEVREGVVCVPRSSVLYVKYELPRPLNVPSSGRYTGWSMLSQKRIAGGTEHTGGRLGMFGKLTPDGARFSPFFAAGTAGVTSGAATGTPERDLSDRLCTACLTAAACTTLCAGPCCASISLILVWIGPALSPRSAVPPCRGSCPATLAPAAAHRQTSARHPRQSMSLRKSTAPCR